MFLKSRKTLFSSVHDTVYRIKDTLAESIILIKSSAYTYSVMKDFCDYRYLFLNYGCDPKGVVSLVT